ncbi:MAG: ATP synthase F0 subunit C [Pseudomonadota bacterium]
MMKVLKRLGQAAVGFFILSVPAMAESVAPAATDDKAWLKMAAAGLTIALAAVGGAIGQGKTASSALEAIGRNPSAQNKIFVPMIVALALIESLVIYALVVVFAKM